MLFGLVEEGSIEGKMKSWRAKIVLRILIRDHNTELKQFWQRILSKPFKYRTMLHLHFNNPPETYACWHLKHIYAKDLLLQVTLNGQEIILSKNRSNLLKSDWTSDTRVTVATQTKKTIVFVPPLTTDRDNILLKTHRRTLQFSDSGTRISVKKKSGTKKWNAKKHNGIRLNCVSRNI